MVQVSHLKIANGYMYVISPDIYVLKGFIFPIEFLAR